MNGTVLEVISPGKTGTISGIKNESNWPITVYAPSEETKPKVLRRVTIVGERLQR